MLLFFKFKIKLVHDPCVHSQSPPTPSHTEAVSTDTPAADRETSAMTSTQDTPPTITVRVKTNITVSGSTNGITVMNVIVNHTYIIITFTGLAVIILFLIAVHLIKRKKSAQLPSGFDLPPPPQSASSSSASLFNTVSPNSEIVTVSPTSEIVIPPTPTTSGVRREEMDMFSFRPPTSDRVRRRSRTPDKDRWAAD